MSYLNHNDFSFENDVDGLQPVLINRRSKPPFTNDEKYLNQIALNIIPNHHFPYVKLENMGSNAKKEPRVKKRFAFNFRRSQFFKAARARRHSYLRKNVTVKIRKYVSSKINSNSKSSRLPSSKYNCHICTKTFSYEATLTGHLSTHEGEVDTPYACSLCDQSFKTSNNLKLHLVDIHSYYCKSVTYSNNCRSIPKWNKKSKKSLTELKELIHKHANITLLVVPRKLSCPLCPKMFPYESNLKRHISSHKEEKKHICQKCGSSYKDLRYLERHLEMNRCELVIDHNSRKAYACSHCEQTFTNLGTRRQHLRRKHGFYPSQNREISKYICIFCGYNAVSPTSLEAHNRIHTGEKPFSCNACSKSYSRKETLTKHMRDYCEAAKKLGLVPETLAKRPTTTNKIRQPPKQLFRCSKCDQTFPSRSQRRKHELTHGDKFPCPFCPAKFGHFVGLGIHKNRVHKDELEDYRCVPCDLEFNSKNAYKVHQKSLHKNKIQVTKKKILETYACVFCEYRTNKADNLKRHNLSHTGEKPFHCEGCGKSFTQKEHLKRHSCASKKRNNKKMKMQDIEFSFKDYSKSFDKTIGIDRNLRSRSLRSSSSLKNSSRRGVDVNESAEFFQETVQKSDDERNEHSALVKQDGHGPFASFGGDDTDTGYQEMDVKIEECIPGSPGFIDHNFESGNIIMYSLENAEIPSDPSVSLAVKIETFESFD